MTAPRIERRLAAILAADVAGYSQLMGADEVGTLTALKIHRRDRIDPSIANHNGRIVKTTGDGLLVEFASVVDAVACAVAIQRSILAFNTNIGADRQIVLRIGINVGDIIIDGGDIFGDGVNVAARLEALCEPGGVYISRSANEQVRDKLRLAFADLGEQTVKNIARAVGVFGLAAKDIAALPEEALPQDEPADIPQPRMPPRQNRARPLIAAAGALAAIVAVVGWWKLHDRGEPAANIAAAPMMRPAPYSAQDRRMSFIVLPFADNSGDATNDGTAARITRELTDRIATDATMPVVSAATAARYSGSAIDLRAIGYERQVHFALTGNVRRQAGRIVVSAALYQTSDERSLWSRRSDRPDSPDGWTATVRNIHADAIQAALDAEVANARRERPNDLDARDYYLASLESSLLSFNKANRLAQVTLLERALALDPDNRQAQAQSARERAIVALNGWSSDRRADLAFAAKTVDRLIALKPRDVSLLATRALVLRAQGELDQALAVRHVIAEIEPQLADNHREIGVMLQMQGQFDQALASFRVARKLMPAANVDSLLDGQMATALLATNDVAEAITLARQALAESAGGAVETPWLTLIAAQAVSGQDEQARVELQRYLATRPSRQTLAEVRKFSFLGVAPNLLEGLRRAGMPAE